MTRILVVDDKPENLYLMQTLFGSHGYTVDSARHGAEALVKARLAPPDIIVSDLLMPVMDGYTLLRRWKADERLGKIPFVVYTATYTEPADERLALDLGADAFILKPTEPGPLIERVSQVLAAGTRDAPVRIPTGAASEREYSEIVIRKLEEKALQLQEANQALAQREEQLRAIFDAEPECVKLLAAGGVLLEINPAGLKIIEAESLEQVKGRSLFPLVEEESRAEVRAVCERVLRGESATKEFQIIGFKGTRRYLDMHAAPVRNMQGEVIAMIGISRDITERRRLEAHLLQAQKMEALGTLAGGIAHDFNNILGAIIGNAALASQDVGADHPAAVSLAEIVKASSRARDLVQQILTFSRHQAHERRVIGLPLVIEECVSLLRATLPTGIELITRVGTDIPNVLADRTQVHQVVMNLCTNAWQAMDGPVGRIELALDAIEIGKDAGRAPAGLEPGRHACLRVTDSGRGMDAATLRRIFDPFFTTKALGEGTGLGLAVVDGIVKNHGGAISVDSVPGRGTTFHVYFPGVHAEVEVPAAADAGAPKGGGQRILYLDDEESLVLLVTRTLERQGYQVQGFIEPADALAAFDADPAGWALFVSDLNMPATTGLEIAAQVLRRRPDLPVALTSGYITEGLRTQAAALGVREVIYKPNTVDELAAAVARMLADSAAPEGRLKSEPGD